VNNEKSDLGVTSIEEQIETTGNAFKEACSVQRYVRKTLFDISRSIKHGRKSIADASDLNDTYDFIDTSPLLEEPF